MTALFEAPATTHDGPCSDNTWNWVLAAPFRLHVCRVLDGTGLPWRALAGYAGVPDNVVRSLLGRPGRRRLRRLAPHYAAQLLGLDPDRVRRDLAQPGSPPWVRLWLETLTAHGWAARRIGAVAGLAPATVEGLRAGWPIEVSRHTELVLSAAVRAHDLDHIAHGREDRPLPAVDDARAA